MTVLIPRNRHALLALTTIFAFGLNSMYVAVYRNGYIDALIRLRDVGPHVLPGSDIPILTKFTGIRPLDKVLTLAGVMFANVTDGSAPHFSLYGFQFAGQLVAVLTVVTIEGVRSGNQGAVMSFSTLWGCAIQGLGYGFSMPLYGIIHLLTSPTAAKVGPQLAKSIHVRNLPFIDALVPSTIVGYILPTVLMALPIFSSTLHQWLGGFWQGFPVWVNLLQHIISYVRSKVQGNEAVVTNGRIPNRADSIHEMEVLYKSYVFAFGVAATTHITTFGILITRRLFPSLLPSSLNIRDVFIPPPFYSREPMRDMATAIQNFFQYDQYVGSTAALAWAAALHCNCRKSPMTPNDWLWLFGEICGVGLVAGPAGALVSLLWNRDERVLDDEALYEEKATQ